MRGVVLKAFCLVFIVAAGCTNSDIVTIADQSYFPLRVGNYQIYDVNETDILQLTCGDGGQTVKNYQLKVLIFDSVKNSAGGYTYDAHRYTRTDSTQAWADLDTWTMRVTSSQVIVNESNVIYVNLIFPLRNNEKWRVNQYNDLKADSLDSLASLGQPYTLTNGKQFKTTLTVVQSNEQNLVYEDKRFEVYASTVGLIYKEITQLNYFTDQCFGQQKIMNGIIYKQTLKSYGR